VHEVDIHNGIWSCQALIRGSTDYSEATFMKPAQKPDYPQLSSDTQWTLTYGESSMSPAHEFRLGVVGRINVDQIKSELNNVTVRQRGIQKRLHSLRSALANLVEVFGPAVLDGDDQPIRVTIQNTSSRYRRSIDLCTAALKESSDWLTIQQIVELIESRSPATLAHFRNPSVSISNSLRTLDRQGKVKRQYTSASGTMWRWIPASFLT
jgi:hypothetical protein